jgi:2,3-bisphosphoglycerate-independent phosphoglycerate mutase
LAKKYKPIVLCILDGWGISKSPNHKYNAIEQASTPCWDFLLNNFPHTELFTSGEDVGLPHGQMGNSEVGHMTIGSGRVIFQDLLRINQSINNSLLENHPTLKQLIQDHKKNNKCVHLLGLCSNGGVHSHIDHIIFLCKLLSKNNIQVRLHLFLDGRDAPPSSAPTFLKQIDELLSNKNIKISTISGRFYAMDRDNRWERCELAYKAIAEGQGTKISNWKGYLETQYQNNIYDEFVMPAAMDDYEGIEENDSLIFTNFRSDRIRQLAQSLLLTTFNKFSKKKLNLSHQIGMTDYSTELSQTLKSLFPEQIIENNLGQLVSNNKKKQLRIAETEKYAHVTFFFNGGREENYPGEDRILVPSPSVHTYDLQPEMSAYPITEELNKAIKSQKYDLIIVNYANTDMVGHSGKMEAAIKAVETIDSCLDELYKTIKQTDGMLMITADHGNAEQMFNTKDKVPHTSHTTNPVPLVMVANDLEKNKVTLNKGNLSDIAPSILKAMNITKPIEMTGTSLFKRNK